TGAVAVITVVARGLGAGEPVLRDEGIEVLTGGGVVVADVGPVAVAGDLGWVSGAGDGVPRVRGVVPCAGGDAELPSGPVPGGAVAVGVVVEHLVEPGRDALLVRVRGDALRAAR